MENIKCSVKLEGYNEVEMFFLVLPNIGHTIEYNDESFEIKTISHLLYEIQPVNGADEYQFMKVEKIEQKKILIHASKCKRL